MHLVDSFFYQLQPLISHLVEESKREEDKLFLPIEVGILCFDEDV